MRPTVRRLLPTRFDVKPIKYNYLPAGFTYRPWVMPLALWGVAAGTFVSLLMSATPIFQHDVLFKVPGLKAFYEDTTPASDKPF
ncbi:hypothetical protein CALVIDRAFT_534433 [Calocera viscosa TUFC12733]|uniref:Cytochrome b-c1 complex subunit 10 n=1 Tax=Calocera viscosa (strain TUFC12733) TaxID=1330018 RepID=A0A167Q5T2_CALVF|nr:hypothetical protein CALVIDRAFT_534433 [Calocera viscosa TUFC12733]